MNGRQTRIGLLVVLLIVACAIIVTGYIVAHSTYLTTYGFVSNGQVQDYASGSKSNGEIGYLRVKDDDAIYLVPTAQLSPKFSAKSLAKTSLVTMTFLPDSTGMVDIESSRHTEFKGLGFSVIALAVTTGKKTVNYATKQYTDNPNGTPHSQAYTGNLITVAGAGALMLFIVLAGMFGRAAAVSHKLGSPLPRPSFPELLFGLVAGIFFIAFSFPVAVNKIGEVTGWRIVDDVGATADSVDATLVGVSTRQQLISFEDLWSKFLLVVVVYLVVLAMVSLKHLRFDLLGLGVVFLALGAIWLHVLSWVAVILIWLLMTVLALLGWIANLLAPIVTLLHNFVAFLFAHGCWAVIVALLLIGAIYLAIAHRDELLDLLSDWLEYVPAVLIWTGLFALGVVVIFLLVKLFNFLLPLLAPILAFLGRISGIIFRFLVYALIVYLIGGTIFGFGAYLLDQFRGAWNSGNGRRGVILGSLAIGVSMALVLLETNLYGAVTYLPSAVAAFVSANLHQNAPIFDLFIALVVVVISILGLLRNLRKLRTEPDLKEFQTGVAMTMLFVPLIAIVMMYAYVHSLTEGQSS